MQKKASLKVGYVVKRYPRYSETFIVNEILDHERNGMNLEIFSLRPSSDPYFQNIISKVRSPVTYIPHGVKATDFWKILMNTIADFPDGNQSLEDAKTENYRDVYQALLLAREIKLRRIQHLHAHFATVATSVARLASIFSGIPYSFTAHAKDIFHEYVKPDDLKRKIRDAARVITVSNYNVDYLQNSFGAPKEKVNRIYNGLDLEVFTYQPRESGALNIIAVGRLVEKKGFSVLIDACSILAKKGIEFSCNIIGEGELQLELHNQVQKLLLEKYVTLPGPYPQSELIHRIGKATVFAAPCIIGNDGNRDGLPTVLLEAMALGTPCISTDVTGIPEIIKSGETGLLASQGDPVSLASALEQLLTNPDLQKRLSEKARTVIENDFDIRQNVRKIRSIFCTSADTKRNDSPEVSS